MPLPLHIISNLRPIHPSLPLLQLFHHIRNPNKTPLVQFPPLIMSWACSSCTFLNPPSQKSNCQICLTPLPSSSSSSPSPPKWACKACTFLNSYSRSNCEICDTRSSISSLSNFEDLDPIDDDLGGSSAVGSIFYPLRRCNTTTVQDSDDRSRDLGANETARNGNGSVERRIDLGDARNSASKRKFEDPFSEDANTVNGSHTTKKAEKVGAGKDSLSTNAEDSNSFMRKLRALGDLIEKPIELDGFLRIKSSEKAVSLENSNAINGFGRGKKARTTEGDKAPASVEIIENADDQKVLGEIKILSYNVWFREDLELHRRMQAIGDVIQLHSPDVICFQEVTSNIYLILQKSMWWKKYCCSVSYERAASEAYFCMQLAKLPLKSFNCKPFSYTAMGRELCLAETEVPTGKSLVIATSHLESPCPGPPTWDQMFSKERVNQAKEAIAFLQKYPNVVFCGDMNWDDKLDGQFPLVEGWFDAWEKLRPGEIGCTYDTKSNKMLTGNRTLQKRLDRFICHLPDFKVSSIEMVGTEPIPDLTYSKQKKMKNKIQELTLPVLPSDHYGLLLTMSSS